ncbi:type II toxin-antitoxin system Phd/YefM family antitoxin [Phenylobacterium sp.]|uniref:type II toxin-antitoxin system Phd/YefM family antitoxin n=1 Tax=Phenylobacterium sp. TaxID=1871053 RepID=UPI0035652427
MLEVPATEVAKRFSRYRQAAQREPVAVTHHSRVTEVLISKHDYDDYIRLKSLATRAFWAHELSTETIHALSTARMDPRHDHLNDLMDE